MKRHSGSCLRQFRTTQMNTFKTKGLVLREYEAGESDKRLVLLCKGTGLLMVYARGARKAKSKFLAASQMLTYGDYVLADGKRFVSMAQADVIESFYPIRQDYTRLCYAQYVLEICEKTIPSRTPCDEVLRLLLKTLQHISKDTPGAVSVFLFRFFLFNGLEPEMNCCCICGCAEPSGSAGVSRLFCEEGIVCHNCQRRGASKTSMLLSYSAGEAVRYILGADLKQAFLFKAEESVLEELALASCLCLRGHFPIKLQTEL